MTKVKFSKELLRDTLLLPEKAISSTLIEVSDYHLHYEIIFLYKGKHWRTDYSVGIGVPESPWESDDEVECEEVRQVIKKIFVWKSVDSRN